MKLLIGFFVMICNMAFGQNNAFKVSCVDEQNKPLTTIKLVCENCTAQKNANEFMITPNDSAVMITATAKNFETITKYILVNHYFTDSARQITLVFELKSKEIEVVIERNKPTIIYASKEESVSDFEFDANGNLLLVTYPKTEKKSRELKVLQNDSIQFIKELDVSIEELVKDYRGNINILTTDNVLRVSIDSTDLSVSQIDKKYFLQYLAPIVDSNYTKKYLSNFSPIYPAFEYYVFDVVDSIYGRIVGIEDTFMMELYRSEYRWSNVRVQLWAKAKEAETGIDKAIWVGANYFTQSLYYKELFAPMFSLKKKLVVLDYANNKMLLFDTLGRKLGYLKIEHGQNEPKSGWCRNVLQDDVTKEVYIVLERNGTSYIRNLNVVSGLLGRERALSYKYVDKLRIHNGKAYYIYRPFESIQKKYLYSEMF